MDVTDSAVSTCLRGGAVCVMTRGERLVLGPSAPTVEAFSEFLVQEREELNSCTGNSEFPFIEDVLGQFEFPKIRMTISFRSKFIIIRIIKFILSIYFTTLI